MVVKYIGFGGGYAEYPVYQDTNGKLYFDMNNGQNGLCLYTGAYKKNGLIEGEPVSEVQDTVECKEPFVRNEREFDYMFLSRMKADCEYFLGYGNRYEGHLSGKTVVNHIEQMKALWQSFPENAKPDWLTLEQIEDYEKRMTAGGTYEKCNSN